LGTCHAFGIARERFRQDFQRHIAPVISYTRASCLLPASLEALHKIERG
jgi:hypothetical protein